MNPEVFITRSAAFLPGEAVGNDDMEAVLGQVGDRPSRARQIVLRSNGIRQRHYAIDRRTGQPTHTNARLAAEAIRRLGDLTDVDGLAVGTSIADQLLPGHGVMVHGELGWPALEVVSLSGICLAGTAALKHAWLTVKAGDARRAVSCASELVSPHMRASCFEPEMDHQVRALDQRPELAFEKDFLRWMLSDGAGALLLEDRPRAALSLRLDWIDLSSAAHELPVCMYAGALRDGQGHLTPWSALAPGQWLERSVFSIRQEVRLLNEHIGRAALSEPLGRSVSRRGLKAGGIDWFLPHMSSMYFDTVVERGLAEAGIPVARERWFTNLTQRGNTGAASPYIMLDELWRSGRIEPGQRLLMFVPESGRFSSGFIHLTAVRGETDGA